MKPLWLSLCAQIATTATLSSVTAGQQPNLLPVDISKTWLRTSEAPKDAAIDLHIALNVPDGYASIEKTALEIATPSHSRYRKHLKSAEALALSTPSDRSVVAVKDWLSQNDIDAILHGDTFRISTDISTAERLLNTTYFTYTANDRSILRTPSVDLPSFVKEHILLITPTTHFPFLSPPRTPSTQPQHLTTRSTCTNNDYASPLCLRALYNHTLTPPPSSTAFAIYATEAAFYSPADLHAFTAQFLSSATNASYTQIGTGDPANGSPSIASRFETALDTQTALGFAFPLQGTIYNLGGVFGPSSSTPKNTYDPFVKFLTDLLTNTTFPSVISISESAPESSLDPTYARYLCSLIGQATTRGISFVASSGDNGPNGDQPSGTHSQIFETEFPASCPYVTAVGGTTNLENEVGATGSSIPLASKLGYFASGGGFSSLFSRPSWQEDVASTYISNYVPSSYFLEPSFFPMGRGVPDVSAISTNLPVVAAGLTVGIGGTSGSTPIWAGVIAVLNAMEISRGRPVLGWVNPWLYSLSTSIASQGEDSSLSTTTRTTSQGEERSLREINGLVDIVEGGNNKGACFFLGGCFLPKTLGFNVTKGWDPVTGLGRPDVGALDYLLSGMGS